QKENIALAIMRHEPLTEQVQLFFIVHRCREILLLHQLGMAPGRPYLLAHLAGYRSSLGFSLLYSDASRTNITLVPVKNRDLHSDGYPRIIIDIASGLIVNHSGCQVGNCLLPRQCVTKFLLASCAIGNTYFGSVTNRLLHQIIRTNSRKPSLKSFIDYGLNKPIIGEKHLKSLLQLRQFFTKLPYPAIYCKVSRMATCQLLKRHISLPILF